MPNQTFYYKGIPSLNGTIVPDAVFDELMAVCSGAEFKVLCYIVRRTFGFKKASDDISLKQICEGITKKTGEVLDRGTGLSKPTATAAVKGLVEKGIVVAERNRSKERGDEPTSYRLRFESETVLKNITRGGKEIYNGGVKKSNTQDTVLQQTVLQYRISKSNALEKFSEKPQRKPSGFQSLESLLKSPVPLQARANARSREAVPPALEAAIADISEKLGDRKNAHANTTQAMRLFLTWGKGEAGFIGRLYEVCSITRQQTGVRSRMPYFFSVLRHELGLLGEQSTGSLMV